MNRLDASGLLNDDGWSDPQLAFDRLTRPEQHLTTDETLRAVKEAEEARRANDPIAHLIPGYNRLR